MRLSRVFSALLLAGGILLAAGCGSGVAKGDLAGAVTYKGKAVKVGTVTAYDDKDMPYQGTITEGKYEIKGIPEGTVKLIVLSPDPNISGRDVIEAGRGRPKREARPEDPAEQPAPKVVGWFKLPKKYETKESSGLTASIRGKTNTQDLTLTD